MKKFVQGILPVVAAFAAAVASPCFAAAQLGIPGQFDVSPLGAATYTVPIQVPPGIAGIEPKLSMSYSSRAGNGLLGVGWTLDGLPAITRCPRTTPQDGVKGAVLYTSDDRFCLDGKRLMVVSGTYGAAGSEYRTEIDAFLKVTALGSAVAGPQSFVVKTKDGLTMEFGGSSDSRVLAANAAGVRVWALNKVSDVMGNTQSIVYGLPSVIAGSTKEFNAYPLRIEYTSNPRTGLAAANNVEFNYAVRPTAEILNAYQGGQQFLTSVRLSGIVTKTNGSVVSTYTPSYSSQPDQRSTMQSLTLCGKAGPCAPVTSFKLGSAGPGLYPFPGSMITPVSQAESSVSGGKWITLDVDGDGITDLVHFTEISGVYRIWKSNGDGTFSIRELTASGDTGLSTGTWQVLDVNGDGLADLVHITATPGLVRVWKSNGDGTFAISPFSGASADSSDLSQGGWLILDVNGDGLADLVHLVGSNEVAIWNATEDMRVWKSNGDGTFTISRLLRSGGTVLWLEDGEILNALFRSKWQVMDVNGDGLADLVQFYIDRENFSSWLIVRQSNGDGTFGYSRSQNPIFSATGSEGVADGSKSRVYTWVPIDVNQDGLTDLVVQATFRDHHVGVGLLSDADLNQSMTLFSKGDGTFEGKPLPSTPDRPLVDGAWQVVDTDGDGLADLVHTPSNLAGVGGYTVWRSKGDGTFSVNSSAVNVDTCSSACTDMYAGDFTGSGAAGFVRVDGKTVKSAWLLGRPPSNLVTGVSNGSGSILSWNIDALPIMLIRQNYAKDVPSNNSAWTLSSAIPVVSEVRKQAVSWVTSNSTISRLNRVTSFSYGSARVERNGRGFVGFRWQQMADSITGLRTRTTFRQDFPYIGLVESRSTGSGGSWDNLSTTTNSYSAMIAGSPDTAASSPYGCRLSIDANCFIAQDKRYFVYPSEINAQSKDLNGALLPRTRILNADPDHYGNLRQETTQILNSDGSPTDYSTVVASTYYNDPANWFIGRLTKRVTDRGGPTVATPVVPGSGGLPPAPAPQLPAQTTATIMTILQLLLSDD